MVIMNLPIEICHIINEYAKPVCRTDWKQNPSPSCIAIYKSDYYRDYRTDIIFKNYLRYGRDVEYIDEDTTWDYWCYWRGVIITEEHRMQGPSYAERGVNREYTRWEAGWWCCWRECFTLDEKWIKY